MREIRVKPGRSLRYTADEVERLRQEPLPDRVLSGIEFIAQAIPESTDWLIVKKRLMLQLPPCQRQLFSTREGVSKKHYPFNSFEQKVRDEWKRLTGNVLLMPDDRKLDGVDPEAYL